VNSEEIIRPNLSIREGIGMVVLFLWCLAFLYIIMPCGNFPWIFAI
jgi:hypothetical protein